MLHDDSINFDNSDEMPLQPPPFESAQDQAYLIPVEKDGSGSQKLETKAKGARNPNQGVLPVRKVFPAGSKADKRNPKLTKRARNRAAPGTINRTEDLSRNHPGKIDLNG
ncbi:hypothetical protein ACFL5V_10970 [Fibrobacterota bacterium]